MSSSKEPIRVGVLYSQSGATAVMEDSMLKATLFAVAEVNESGGIDGRELLPIHYDPASDPATYSALADRLLGEDGVRIIFGCYMSSTRKAVLPVVERRNGLLFYAAQYEGFEYSRNVIYTGALPNQNSVYLAHYLLDNYGSRFYMVGSDYVWPWESDRIMSEILGSRNGTVVGERYFKLDADKSKFDRLIRSIKRERPDVIFCNFVGESIGHFHHAYADAGLDPKTMPIASLTTSESDVKAMGISAAVGHITSASYFQTIDSQVNRRCVRSYQARFGADQVTNMCWESAYFQVHILADALRRTASEDVDVLHAAILGVEYDALQGRVRIDPDNSHTYVWRRIGQVRGDGQFQIVRESEQWLKPDPYFVSEDPNDWGSQFAARAS